MSYKQSLVCDNFEFDYKLVDKTIRWIPQLRKNQLLKQWGCNEEPATIKASQSLLLWTADILWQLSPIDSEQQLLIVNTYFDDIRRLGERLEKDWNSYLVSHASIVIADRGYAWVTWKGWGTEIYRTLSLTTGKMVIDASPYTETIAYDLTSIFVRNVTQLIRKREGKDAGISDTSRERV